jgi:hypothetical protein
MVSLLSLLERVLALASPFTTWRALPFLPFLSSAAFTRAFTTEGAIVLAVVEKLRT